MGGLRPFRVGPINGNDAYVLLRGHIFSVQAWDELATGQISVGALHRQWARLTLEDEVDVESFVPSSGCELLHCRLEVGLLRRGAHKVQESVVRNSLLKMSGQFLEVGQPIALGGPSGI